MSRARPKILLTNDDGITSPGLHAAYRELAHLGSVTVVAPDAQRSAVGHAITLASPLRFAKVRVGTRGIGYSVSGMPADCVKLAVGSLLKMPPDLVVSGINLGPNTGTNVIYSGTVSAATEARILGIPSIAVSLDAFDGPRWITAAKFARRIAAAVLERGLPRKVLLNVNVPNLKLSQVKGVRVTKMGESGYVHSFSLRKESGQKPYYWSTSKYENTDTDQSTDAAAVAAGWVTITPVTYDLTAYDVFEDISAWKLLD